MIKILIVDDKTENLYLLQFMLETNGFKTISAKNGTEALGLMRNNIPDLIIADILMPVMDGFTLCRECKKDEILKNIPFFFYTATYIDAKDEEYALSLGADRFILKPQEPDDFIKIINDFLNEVKGKKIHPIERIQQPETVVLKEYNEVLIRKIEDKMLQTEKADKDLRKYAEELEKEIHERKRNEKSLLKSEEYNRLLFNTSPIGLALCRMDGSLIDINPAYAKIIGRTIEETLKLNYWDITPEKYVTQETEQLKNLEETGHYGKYEKEYIHKDGHLVPVLLQGLILERDGEHFIWSTAEDITERKKVEMELHERERQLSSIYQTVGDIIFHLAVEADESYRFISVNQAFINVTGLSEDMIVGKLVNEVIPESSLSMVLGKYRQAIKESSIIRWEEISDYPAGRLIGDVSIAPVIDNNGLCTHLVGSVHDISERIKAEDEIKKLNESLEQRVIQRTGQLEAANKELEAFSYSVSHDLRSPLRHINSFAEILTKQYSDQLPEDALNHLNTIIGSARKMGTLIDDLLSFSRTGRAELKKSSIKMNMVVDGALEQIKPSISGRKIDWKVSSLPEVYGDYNLLRLVWINLLDNALKYTRTRKKTVIQIGYNEENNELVFYIKDNGVGFDMKYAQKLFGVFQRLHSSAQFEGTGIGLANVHRIILRHGGRTWVEAETDKGATFYFSIPKEMKDGR